MPETPSTEDVRWGYSWGRATWAHPVDEAEALFDRWLAAHDAEKDETIEALRAEVRQAQGRAERMQAYIAGMPYPSDLADAIRRAKAAEAEVATLRAKVAAVEALHVARSYEGDYGTVTYCWGCEQGDGSHPCPTSAALADPEVPRDA